MTQQETNTTRADRIKVPLSDEDLLFENALIDAKYVVGRCVDASLEMLRDMECDKEAYELRFSSSDVVNLAGMLLSRVHRDTDFSE
jgi:hypothetical protein